MLEKCVLTILELNWNQRLEHKETKLNICHRIGARRPHNCKQVISRRRKNENVFKMPKDEKCTCKAYKNSVFHCQICKFVGFLLPSSSWLLKLLYESFHAVVWRRFLKLPFFLHVRRIIVCTRNGSCFPKSLGVSYSTIRDDVTNRANVNDFCLHSLKSNGSSANEA